MIRRVSLAGQLLILQLGIVLVVLVAVSAVSVAQAQASFREVQGRRILSVAERAAASDIVRKNLPDPAWRNRIAAVVDGYRGESVADHALVAGTDRRVLASTDPSQVGRILDLRGSNLLQGRAWEGWSPRTGSGRWSPTRR
jgi:two-component system, CitB family, sensor kinase